MTFKDIACHVWAIEGYKDDDTAAKANTAYNTNASSLIVQNNKSSRSAALKAIVEAVRAAAGSVLTKERVVIYGGFRRGQKAPEHMWMEYNGQIYETMPGYDIHMAAATDKYRKCPPLENEEFGEQGVAVYETYLTENQKAYIEAVTSRAVPLSRM